MPQTKPITSSPPNPAAARRLLSVARQAYILYPKNCSGSVHYVITQLVDPKAPYRLANQLMQWLATPASGWRQVKIQDVSDLANRGLVVVGGLAELGGHGHVLIILPGPWKRSGGYRANGQIMPFRGLFPPVMSTALGSWPGTMSDGDKTAYDAWGNIDIFKRVTFWTKTEP